MPSNPNKTLLQGIGSRRLALTRSLRIDPAAPKFTSGKFTGV